MNVHLSATWKR